MKERHHGGGVCGGTVKRSEGHFSYPPKAMTYCVCVHVELLRSCQTGRQSKAIKNRCQLERQAGAKNVIEMNRPLIGQGHVFYLTI